MCAQDAHAGLAYNDFSKSMTMQHILKEKGGTVLFGGSQQWGHVLKQNIHFEGSSSFIFFVSSLVLSFSWLWEANLPIVEAWIPKTLWCNDLYYQFNVISILLLPFYIYCFVYGLITHLHVCYRILIIEKCFYSRKGTYR